MESARKMIQKWAFTQGCIEMKTAVTQTSISAYYNKAELREKQRRKVLDSIKLAGLKGICIADVADAIGLEKSSVAARFNELKKDGVIEMVDKRPSRTTGITSEHWRYKLPDALFSLN